MNIQEINEKNQKEKNRVLKLNSKKQKTVHKNDNKNKGGQILLAIITLLAIAGYAVCVVLFWDNDLLTGCAWDNYGPFGAIVIVAYGFIHCFSSWLNAGIYLFGPIVLGTLIYIFMSKNKGKSLKNYENFIWGIFWISLSVGVVGSIVASFVSDMHIPAMICLIGYGAFFVILIPFICLLSKTCDKCGMYDTKISIGSDTEEYDHENYVPGGYRYTTSELKDSNGNKVGEIETKKYEEGYSYTTTSKVTTTYYKCTNCGHETSSRSSR